MIRYKPRPGKNAKMKISVVSSLFLDYKISGHEPVSFLPSPLLIGILMSNRDSYQSCVSAFSTPFILSIVHTRAHSTVNTLSLIPLMTL